jgi:plasmid maintenance system antidote protein VapI
MKPHPLTEWRWSQRPPMTQAGLARLLGVTRSHVNHIESRRRKISDMVLVTAKAVTKLRGEVLRPDDDA